MIVDTGDPPNPREAGRWWLPGTRGGDANPPPQRHTHIDAGFRLRNDNVYPQRPDRAYLGRLDGGPIVLDISNQPLATSWRSETIIVGPYFNAGVAVHDITNLFCPQEVAYCVPPAPDGLDRININDV